MIDEIVETFKREQDVDLRQDRIAMQRIREAAEQARIELSAAQQTEINLPFIHTDEEGPRHLSQTLSRARLEELVDSLIQRTALPCQAALQDAGIPASGVDEVILVGGMTRMPKVQQMVAELFGREPHRGVNPDEVVAMGAAVQGGVLSGELQDIVLLDVTPFSLGIRTKGGGFSKLIDKNEPIPCKMAKTFTTAQHWQTHVTVMVAQGEETLFADNTFLGEFELEGLPLALRGTPRCAGSA
ncbi:MAG: Hsp70 family protein [Magnetococcus sp. YQC-3]